MVLTPMSGLDNDDQGRHLSYSGGDRSRPYSPVTSDRIIVPDGVERYLASIHSLSSRNLSTAVQAHVRDSSTASSFVEALDLAEYSQRLNPSFSSSSPSSVSSSRFTTVPQSHNDNNALHDASQRSGRPPTLPTYLPSTPPSSYLSQSHCTRSVPPRLPNSIVASLKDPFPSHPEDENKSLTSFSQKQHKLPPSSSPFLPLDRYSKHHRRWDLDESSESDEFSSPIKQEHSLGTQTTLPRSARFDPLPSPQLSEPLKEERGRTARDDDGRGGEGTGKGMNSKPVSGVDDYPRLDIHGRRRRIVIRCIQSFLSLGATVSALYAAFFAHPNPPAPPSTKPPVYLLYIFSPVTFLILFFMFVIRAGCFSCGRRERKYSLIDAMDPFYNVETDVSSIVPSTMEGSKNKKRIQKAGHIPRVPIRVDILFDSHTISQNQSSVSLVPEKGSADGTSNTISLSPSPSGVLAFQTSQKRATKELQMVLIMDIIFCLLWFIIFAAILLSGRCKPGSYGGWCNGYNTATACAFFLGLAFFISFILDVRDHSTRHVPPDHTHA